MGGPGAWRQPEEDGGGDKAGALILNQYGGPRCVWPERLSSTNMGSQVAWSQPEEDGKRKRGQGRSTDPQPIWGVQVEKDGGEDKAGALILNQYGVPGAWSQPEEERKTEAGTKTAALILNQYGGFRLRKTEVRTRPERLSSTNMGVQVRGVNLKKTEAGTRPERLSSTNMGVPGAYGRSAYPQPIWGPRCVVST